MSDLPDVSSTTTQLLGSPILLEAVGPQPGNQLAVTSVHLLARDVHSIRAGGGEIRRTVNEVGAAYSYERWIQLRVDPPLTVLTGVRFWVDTTDLNADWTVLWGYTPTYRRPSRTPSSIAGAPVPTQDPGRFSPNIPNSAVRQVGASFVAPWIVLQAAWTGATPSDMQSAPLPLKFAYEAC